MTPVRNVGVSEPIKPRETIARCMALGLTRAQAKVEYRRLVKLEWWGNETYTVSVDRDSELHGFGPTRRCVHLSIHRRDRAPCTDWRDLQAIKDTVLGEDAEAVSLHPAAGRVVDTANEFHLWAIFDRATGEPGCWPVGFPSGAKRNGSSHGAVQRPHEGSAAP